MVAAKSYYLIGLMMLIFLGSSVMAQSDTLTLTINDQNRSAIITVPSDETGINGLIIALHPFASSAKAMQALTGLDTLATDNSFVIAYPQAIGFGWDDGRSLTALQPVFEAKADVEFLVTLAESLAEQHSIPSDRIYLTGMGNGGTMAFKAACEQPATFGGVIAIAASMWSYHVDQCPDTTTNNPVNILLVNGSKDPYYPPTGRVFREEGLPESVLSQAETLAYWAQVNQCDDQPADDEPPLLIPPCDNSARLAAVTIAGMAHVWPVIKPDANLNRLNLSASDLIAAFILDHDWQTIIDAAEFPQNEARSYTVYIPSNYDPTIPTPLVTVLHGSPGNATGIAYITDMNVTAEQEGFIVLYPDGIDNSWNYTRGLSLFGNNPRDDVLFITELIDDLGNRLNLDENRLYMSGFSNGGFMTQRLACSVPDEFAAFAVVGATGFYGMTEICPEPLHVNMLFIHGTEDVSVPWEGLVITLGGERRYMTLPVPQSTALWARLLGCDADFTRDDIPKKSESASSQVTKFTFQNCPDTAELVFYGVLGGGHNWPGVPGRISDEIAGVVNTDVNANALIWEFFSQHHRTESP